MAIRMKTYTVNIIYIASVCYEIEAINEEQAEDKAWQRYDHADLNGSSEIESINEEVTA
jgi:hypothetical protein